MICKKFIIGILSVIVCVSCQNSNVTDDEGLKYSDIIEMGKEDIKTILGISLDSRWDLISDVFSIEQINIRNNIFRKDLLIEGYNTELVVFIDDNNIYQITLFINQIVNNNSIDIFMEQMMNEIDKYISIEPSINIIENDDGSILEQTMIFTFAHKIFFISINKECISFNLSNNNNY